MTQKQAIQLFEERKVRTVWDDETEKWYFAIVDVVAILTESADAAAYWRKLKQRLKAEGNETVTNCHGLKMLAADGKMRLTDVADTTQLFRLIQSIPSPKAEPFKQWMAQVASDRLDQMQDPEMSIEQAMADYKRAGIFRELDKPTPEKHGGPQGTHRRMAAPGRRGPAIRNSDGHYHPSVGGPHDKILQAVQRVEKGKPARQHDQYRIGVEYAGRSVRYGDFQTTPSQRIPAEC